MGELYSVTDIAKLVSVTPETIKHWEEMRFIPQASRMGLQRKRVWGKTKAKLILEFARDNGYIIHDWTLPPELRGSDGTG